MTQPRLILLYHFFHPDEVISARLYSDLAVEMAERGWAVTALPAARLFDNNQPLPKAERWRGIQISRQWRPAFSQSSNVGRVANALTMIANWTWQALWFKRSAREVVVIGTDPILSVLVAIPWRLLRPRSRLVHWCHDLHPEASLAEGSLRENSILVKILRWLLRRAYRRFDAIVDLGPCMRGLLQADAAPGPSDKTHYTTITPWALVEPESTGLPDAAVRYELFGDCQLALLYSGNLGRAHQYDLFLELIQRTAPARIRFCFAGRGARMAELKNAARSQELPVSFADFASESQLNSRLQAADVHLVSLKEHWTGTVVPSKFFGALAIGRPVLFLGSAESALARWINEFGVGWHLTESNIDLVAKNLQHLAQHPEQLYELNQHCQQVYQREFSKARQLDKWQEVIDASAGGLQ